MKSGSLMSHSRELVTCPCPEPHESRCGIGSGQSCLLFLPFVSLIDQTFSNNPIYPMNFFPTYHFSIGLHLKLLSHPENGETFSFEASEHLTAARGGNPKEDRHLINK